MKQGSVLNQSGTRTQAYVSLYYKCVWATPGHRSRSVHRPQFTPPSSSNNQGGHATRRPYLPIAPSCQRHWNIQSP